ncbi:AAA family ATPase [Streptomyces acidiscabies]|uniref:AAA family ATPase n=1 Tax=Streptomyces acidiscabies TaxID=42234 RepID=UPI00076E524A|nr:LuxR family transcriptional regulator [Streptomyces acidiscabies]GAQ50967.1 putative HTH-type transcriptional [Streptomyces acidiscabies]GAV38754.1 putative HTH-type transcriptional [Streptomyces acidiscabies]
MLLTCRRDLLDTARAELAAAPGVLFHGPAGIGKSTLVDALLTTAPAATVLRCSPSEDDAQLPYAGLVDLFAQVPDSRLDSLAPPLREALRGALLRGEAPGDGRGRLAVRVAVLDVLRGLASERAVLLVVDGVQWLDAESAEVLAFVVRRVGGLDLRVVAAERVADGERPEGVCPPGTAVLRVPPLSYDEVARIVRADLPPDVLRALQETAAGNPSYALELQHSPLLGPVLDVPRHLRTRLLAGMPEGVRRTLLVASAAERPSLTVLRAAGLDDPACGLAAAGGDGVVRFAHPVVRAAVYADASAGERREAHALLAGAVGDLVERARHLAYARPYEDEDTARTLESAAEHARGRGEPDAAFELARLAARRTPGEHARAERLLAAAGYACDAGRQEEAGEAAEAVLAGSGHARQRVRARVVLLRNAGQALEGAHELIAEGLRDAAGDAEAEGWLHYWAAVRGLLCGELTEAARHARRAAVLGDTDTRVGALATLGRVLSLAGEPDAAGAALEEALALTGGHSGPDGWGLIRMRAILALDSDRVGEARAQVAGLLAVIGEVAGVEETTATLVALTRIQVRAGDCREALATAARCEAGVGTAPVLYARALAATVGGTADEARRLAGDAVRASEADGDRLFLVRALAVLGQAELLTGDPQGAATAVEALQRVRDLGEAMGAADPPLLHWYADLAEALVVLGESDEAGAVLREARARMSGEVPGSALAALERAEGLHAAGLGDAKEGVVRLRTAVERLRRLPLPVDLVRTLIALGTVERRARHRSAARAVLGEALETAERIGAAALAVRAGAELARLDAGERGEGPGLTPTEARIAELVGGGATNREVAAKLFISVKTVEGALSRVYRKVGVRSRTALAHAMAVAVLASGAAVDSPDDERVVPAVTVGQPSRSYNRRFDTRR